MGQVRLQVPITVELEDLTELSDEEIQALEREIRDIIDTEGSSMQGMAQGIVPVRTGNLMDSIFYEADPDNLNLTIGATAEYASFVEQGTYKMRARPYLAPAAEVGQEELDARIEQAILDRLDQKLTGSEEGDQVTIEIEKVTAKDE